MENIRKYEKALWSKYQTDVFDFVRNCSIYKLLENYNEYLLTVNCSISVLHYTVKYNRDNSSFDLEDCVTKVFNHFSPPAKTVSELQEVFRFVSIECQEIMRHAPGRWLYFAVERILKYIPRIRSYISSLKVLTQRLFWQWNNCILRGFLCWLLKLGKFYLCNYYWNVKYCEFH